MKKILAATMTVLMVVSLTANVYGVQTTSTTTTASVNVGSIFSISFMSNVVTPQVPKPPRSTTSFSFKTVDGSSPSGWYYNVLATLGADGNPNDQRSDVGLICKSNVTGGYTVAIKQSNATYANAIGYYVKSAYDAGAASETIVAGAIPGSGFYPGTLDEWGTLTTSNKGIFDTTSAAFATYGILIPVSFALVPIGLTPGSSTTTITYTMTSKL